MSLCKIYKENILFSFISIGYKGTGPIINDLYQYWNCFLPVDFQKPVNSSRYELSRRTVPTLRGRYPIHLPAP